MTDENRSTLLSETWYHDQLQAVVSSLNSIDKSLTATTTKLESLIVQAQDHETRIRVIEKWQSGLVPIVAAVIFVCGTLFTLLLERLL